MHVAALILVLAAAFPHAGRTPRGTPPYRSSLSPPSCTRRTTWPSRRVRAQRVRRDGTLLDDLVLQQTDSILHVRNPPSPAATASLAIGSEVAQRAIAMLDR